jgi:hypothetical protein
MKYLKVLKRSRVNKNFSAWYKRFCQALDIAIYLQNYLTLLPKKSIIFVTKSFKIKDDKHMKKIKLTAALMLAAVLLLSMTATAFAAGNSDVIKALKDAKVPETYIIQAENYLKTHQLTSDEASAVITQINQAAAIMKEAGTKDITKLSTKNKQEILGLVSKAGEAVGVKVSVKKNSNGTYSVIGTDASGKEVANFTAKEVKQTGIDYTVMLLGAALILAAIGSTFFIRRYASDSKAA